MITSRSSSSSSITLPPLSDIRASLLRDEYLLDPVRWVQEVLQDTIWSKQKQILESVRDHRRTAVQSCHGAGKSFIAARVVAHWISTHPPGTARVVTTAPTGDQVKAILWQEIGRAHTAGNLIGRLNQTEWWILPPKSEREELVGIGRKPSDYAPDSFQGIHERYVLVVLDEASGIPSSLWEAADGLLSNDDCRLLSIGNPLDPTSEFANECKPGSGANVIRISAFDTPNFTGETITDRMKHRLVGRVWVEEKKRKWGEDNPLYISKVLGLFPQLSTDGLIPISWIQAAQERTLEPGIENELGVDVGGGSNKSVVCHRRGSVFRIIRRDHNPDTMQTLGNVMSDIQTTGATITRIDSVGIGWGMVDRAAEIGKDESLPLIVRKRAQSIIGIKVGESSNDKENYANLRAEGYWGLRERFQDGDVDIDPNDDDLAAQLVALKYKRAGRGQILIESKEDMRKRGVLSPDDADALMLSQLKVKEKDRPKKATWGKRRKDRGRR